MARALSLEAFGARLAPKNLEEPAPPPPEESELYKLGYDAGYEAGRQAGYAAGAIAAGAEHKAILAMAGKAIEGVSAQRAEIEKTVAVGSATLVRALVEKIAPSLLERGFATDALASLARAVERSARGRGVLFVAPETRVIMRDALADAPELSELELDVDERLDRFAVRFEWRDGLAEVDADAIVRQALAILDEKLAAARGVADGDESTTEPAAGPAGRPEPDDTE